MTEQINSSCDIATDNVYDLLSLYRIDAPVQSLSTLPISETIHIHSETDYTILEKNDITNCIIKLPPKTIKFYTDVLCKKITLLNFPVGQHILNLNGQNCATAKCENISKRGQDYFFDFSQEQSKTIATYISCYIDPTEPVIENRDHYINLSRVDNIRIFSSNTFQEGMSYKIKFEGYIKDNNQWTLGEKIMEIYPTAYLLDLNHPTDCLDLCLKKINKFENAKMTLRIDGEIYATHTFTNFETSIRIKCKNLPNRSFQTGAQNYLLSENITQNTINFSRVDAIELILINCDYTSVHQYRYMCYAYPSRALRYSN